MARPKLDRVAVPNHTEGPDHVRRSSDRNPAYRLGVYPSRLKAGSGTSRSARVDSFEPARSSRDRPRTEDGRGTTRAGRGEGSRRLVGLAANAYRCHRLAG